MIDGIRQNGWNTPQGQVESASACFTSENSLLLTLAQKPFRHQDVSAHSAWMLSLADLSLLLLTFCVLVFSMLVPTQEAWHSLIRGLSTRSAPIVVYPVAETSPPYAADAKRTTPGYDPRYIEALLEAAQQGMPASQTLARRWDGERLVLRVPAITAEQALTQIEQNHWLAPILDRLPNQVSVELVISAVPLSADQQRQRWEQGLTHAEHAAKALQNSGYASQIDHLVRIASGQEGGSYATASPSLAESLDIIVLPEAKE